MNLYKLNKQVLSFKNGAEQFLNGLSSNSMDKPQNAFCTVHGRIACTFDQIKINDEQYDIVLEKNIEESLMRHLERYLLLSGVQVVRQNFNVYFDMEGNGPLDEGDLSIPQKKGRLILTKKQLPVNVSDEEFRLFRLKNNIPWFGVDYQPDEMLLNVSETDFVSYTKGCYLGQEFISKVSSRSKPTWKLVVRPEDECSDEEKQKMTSKTLDPVTQTVLGFVFVKN